MLKGQAPKLGWYHLYGMSDLAQEEAEKGTFSKVLSLDAGEPGRHSQSSLVGLYTTLPLRLQVDQTSGYNVYKAHALGLGRGGGTPLCPFDCKCCY